MATAADARRIEAVRAFNRDYTRVAGLLTENLLETRHSLTEARVIFELDPGSDLSMLELRARIGLDPGYLSRLVSRLQRRGLIDKRRSTEDGRVQLLRLTAAGAREKATLDERSAEQVGRLLEGVDEPGRDELVGAMRTITGMLGEREREVVLRPLRSGDIGWILERHGVLFPREYGWGLGFERLVAGVLAEFAERRDEPGFGGWIAEVGGAPRGLDPLHGRRRGGREAAPAAGRAGGARARPGRRASSTSASRSPAAPATRSWCSGRWRSWSTPARSTSGPASSSSSRPPTPCSAPRSWARRGELSRGLGLRSAPRRMRARETRPPMRRPRRVRSGWSRSLKRRRPSQVAASAIERLKHSASISRPSSSGRPKPRIAASRSVRSAGCGSSAIDSGQLHRPLQAGAARARPR